MSPATYSKKMRASHARFSLSILTANVVLGSLASALPAFTPVAMAANLTVASGGSSIASNTVGGSWTSLTGPVITSIGNNDISSDPGTIVLNVPSGFVFDTGGTAPSVLVTCTSNCGGGANNNVNNLTSGQTIAAVVNIGGTTVTVSISDDVDGGSTQNSLTWQNLRVRPTAVLPLASGNITRSTGGGNVGISGVGTNFGTLTETGPTCNGNNGTIVVVNSTIYGGPMNGLAYNGILIGTSGADVIVGTTGADYVEGLGGNDTICGSDGNDILNGGATMMIFLGAMAMT